MKKLISVTLALLMVLSLAACGDTDAGAQPAPAETPAAEEAAPETPDAGTEEQAPADTDEAAAETSQDPAFSEAEIPVIRDDLDSTETAAVRFYEDLPSVPYMSVTDFYNRFYLINTDLKEGMSFVRDGGTYTVTNICDDKAVFDVDAETIVIDNMGRFIKLACDLKSAESSGMDPDYPYSMTSFQTDPEEATPKTLSLADYDIDLRGDETGVYAPLPTIADIFTAADGYYVVYSGEKLYVRDAIGLYFYSVMEEDPDYLPAIKKDRSGDMVEYAYNELCFNMDLWYGRPGLEFIHKELETKQLDEVLTEQFPEIKEMLLAKDFETYFGGLIHLYAGLLFDGGHTGMSCNALQDDEFELATKYFKEVRAKDIGATYNLYATWRGHETPRMEARESFYNGDYYVEKGDTAVICFNKFTVDVEGWKNFYAQKGERPFLMEDEETGGETYDTVGVVLSGLERAAKNPKIKNIVIDDSCNGGGNDIAMLAIENLMMGEGYVRDRDFINNQYNTKTELFDLNFDGKIDDQDKSPYTEYRYGVLTSDGSFSCGNSFPFFMKEHGAMIMGQKSSGGACSIRITSARGIEVQSSVATNCNVTKDGESVDTGCPVDVELLSDGENPYENFYDLDTFSKLMNEFYDGTEENAA